MEYRAVQQIAKDAMGCIVRKIRPGMCLNAVRQMCEERMRVLGADSFWYWDVGAFVFAGDETAVSVSGKEYRTSDRVIEENDIITIDLSPQVGETWGDYARTVILEKGKIVEDVHAVRNDEWREGLKAEIWLHEELARFAEPDTTFEQLYSHMNTVIAESGFINLDFAGNLGHSIARRKEERIYTKQGNQAKLGSVKYFTFEPHISRSGSKYGFKREDIYYFEKGKLKVL